MRVSKFRSSLYIFISLVVFSLSIHASKKTYGDIEIEARDVVRVYDGDTITVNIKQFPDIIGCEIGIRVDGIDTPEMRDKNESIKELARLAKMYVIERLQNAKKIVLKDLRRGKYFRIVAKVIVDGVDIGLDLIAEGLAKPYDGGRKDKWIEQDVADFWALHEKSKTRVVKEENASQPVTQAA